MVDVTWAAPVHPTYRVMEAGEDTSQGYSILKKGKKLPFPKFYLKSEYESLDEYERDKEKVMFNRALLTNGFRRLEAIETKKEYEVGLRTKVGSSHFKGGGKLVGNPVEPSIMLSTLCASTSISKLSASSSGKVKQSTSSNFSLKESGIDITCAKLCLPDGRHVAAGCTDSAVRIWSINSSSGQAQNRGINGISPSTESAIVLVGHKKGLPVYDVDWNRDGRTLLSAGGDGTIRLWDSEAVGPFGKLASVTRRTPKNSNLSKKKGSATQRRVIDEPSTHVPDAKPEPMVEKYGAALACYQGHAQSTPVWKVAMAPSGYYFASAGSDSTARLWCTDRPTPVRIFMGHHSQNVNGLTWHPNCNYLLTGSDDKTVRMWDVQSGSCVRILSGCNFGVNQLKVSPSGQYVAGADYGGTLSIWDLRNGRKLNELYHVNKDGGRAPVIHSISYSPCGTTIATGGDDCCVRIWDARGIADHNSNPEYAASVGWGQSNHRPTVGIRDALQADTNHEEIGFGKRTPVNIFPTSRTMILDLEFTKRNLLLSVGKLCC
mmetsp:Transcript_12470/g.14066  ORF Transcript_12470/g.14066 Transcript_12470/m.14066 type:complete len:546 (-) Transcript_12470:83-1720(-)